MRHRSSIGSSSISSSASPQELGATAQSQFHVGTGQSPSSLPQPAPQQQMSSYLVLSEAPAEHHGTQARTEADCQPQFARINLGASQVFGPDETTGTNPDQSQPSVAFARASDHQTPGFRRSLSSLALQHQEDPRNAAHHCAGHGEPVDGLARSRREPIGPQDDRWTHGPPDWRSHRPAIHSNHRQEDTRLIRAIFSSSETIYWRPAVSERNSESEYVLEVMLPGTDPMDVGLTFYPADLDTGYEQSSLVISGHAQVSPRMQRRGGDDVCWYERFTGPFERVIRFDDAIDASGIEVSFSHGIATVVLPKSGNERENDDLSPYMLIWRDNPEVVSSAAHSGAHVSAEPTPQLASATYQAFGTDLNSI